jgi:hypothetical protein
MGAGGFRTTRALACEATVAHGRSGLFAGSLATDLAHYGSSYCRGVQGFVADVVPKTNLGTSSVPLLGSLASSGRDRLEEVTTQA